MTALTVILMVSLRMYSREDVDCMVRPDSIPKAEELQVVVVSGVRSHRNDTPDRISVSGADINRQPAILGEHDVIKTLQVTPGVTAGMEGFAGLYVRGGETDQNLHLLDGLPILNVYHFGGLFSAFTTHAVDRVQFYKGTFPAYYSGMASGIVDIDLKEPDYLVREGIVSVGLISGQAYYSTPVKKQTAALAVSLRRTWADLLYTPVLSIINATRKQDGRKTVFHYGFADLTVKLNVTDRRRNDLSLLLFMGKDNFRLGEERFDPAGQGAIHDRDINRMSWGNLGASVGHTLSTGYGKLKIRSYVSRAFSSDVQETMRDGGGPDQAYVRSEIRPAVIQAGIRESFHFPVSRWLDGELGMQQAWHDYDTGNLALVIDGAHENDRFGQHSRNLLMSAYGALGWNDGKTVGASAGLRVDRFLSHVVSHWNIEPRLSLSVRLPHSAVLSMGYARTVQYAQQVSSNYIYLPSDAWLPTASYFRPLICDLYSMGYLREFRKVLSLKTELWWKNMENLAEFRPGTSVTAVSVPWHEQITFGKGWAYGLDMQLDGQHGPVTWNLAYGLMWNWRRFPDLNSGRRFPAKFDNRHKVDIGFAWRINGRLELSGQWEYMTGNRTTMALYNIAPPDAVFPDAPFINPVDPEGERQDGMDYFESRNNVRLPAFHRLNLSLSLKGRPGKNLSSQWDFGLYNAYCRMNPFSLRKNYVNPDWNSDKGDYRGFRTLSLIPVLPSVSYTLYF